MKCGAFNVWLYERVRQQSNVMKEVSAEKLFKHVHVSAESSVY